MHGFWKPLVRAGIAAMLALASASCATPNRYDGLNAVTLDRVTARVAQGSAGARRLGIAFGGGGVRGFAHLGVMRALEEAGIRADVVTGSSVGAAAAALYASGLAAGEIEARARSVSERDLADLVISRQGLFSGQRLAAWIREATGQRGMRDLPLPLGIAVTDLERGVPLAIVGGDVGEAVQASASVPGTVIPVESGGALLIDGGVLTLVPVRLARAMGADLVVGVDIYCGNEASPKGHAVDTLLKSIRLQSCRISEPEMREADVLIRALFEPSSATSFSERERAIEAGYRAAAAIVPALRQRLGGESSR